MINTGVERKSTGTHAKQSVEPWRSVFIYLIHVNKLSDWTSPPKINLKSRTAALITIYLGARNWLHRIRLSCLFTSFSWYQGSDSSDTITQESTVLKTRKIKGWQKIMMLMTSVFFRAYSCNVY